MLTAFSSYLERQRRNFSDLFFVRRRPKWLGVPKEWEAPQDEATYQSLLKSDDFLSAVDFPEDAAAKHPVIVQDMNDIRQYLLPTFYEMSQKSKYYQNLYYFYQWIFIFGAFFTTLFGTLATYNIVGNTETSTAVVTPEADASAQGVGEITPESTTVTTIVSTGNNFWSRTFGIITAIIGALTAFTTTLSNRSEPQKRWGNTRRLAEEMRMHYYKYISHQPPYDGGDRLSKLREIIMKIKEQEYV